MASAIASELGRRSDFILQSLEHCGSLLVVSASDLQVAVSHFRGNRSKNVRFQVLKSFVLIEELHETRLPTCPTPPDPCHTRPMQCTRGRQNFAVLHAACHLRARPYARAGGKFGKFGRSPAAILQQASRCSHRSHPMPDAPIPPIFSILAVSFASWRD